MTNFKIFKTAIAVLLIGSWFIGCAAKMSDQPLVLFNPVDGNHINEKQLYQRLLQAPIVLVGERHTNQKHHKIQLGIIKTMQQAGLDISIGLEMFRKDSQSDLTSWINGELSEKEFEKIYLENWNYPWSAYRDIFIYAKEHQIEMVGLNVSAGITRQVAYHGFDSLSEDQKRQIGEIRCDINTQYTQFIKKAFNAHAHGRLDFDNFCEAQLIWDTVMAKNAVDHITKNPHKHIIILTGTGHARKMAIPAQIKKYSGPQTLVILPDANESGEDDTKEAADYFF